MAITDVRDLFKDQNKKKTSSGVTDVRDLYVTEDYLKELHSSVQNRIESWANYSNEFYNNVNDYYKNFDDSVYGLDSSKEWQSKASNSANWIQQESKGLFDFIKENEKYFDSEWVSNVLDYFVETKKATTDIVNRANQGVEYWSQFKNESQYHDYYYGNKYKGYSYTDALEASKTTEGKESDWLNKNLDNFKSSAELQAEIDALNKNYDLDAPYLEQALKHTFGDVYDWLDSGVKEGTREWARDEKARLTELKATATKREEDQEFLTTYLPSALNPEIKTPDFAEYIEQGKSKGKGKGDWDGPFVQGYKSDIIAVKEGKLTASGDGFYQKFINSMDDDQYNNYAYLFGKYGKKVADNYLRVIEPEIDAKEGQRMKELADAPVLDNLFHAFANWERLAGDIGSIFSDEAKNPSPVQIADQLLGAEKKGFEKALWDVDGNIAYMMPSILAGRVTSAFLGPAGYGVMGAKTAGAVGQAGLTALSSYGAGRQEMLNLGYSESQANMYGLLSGASEAGLQYLIGGMGKYTGLWADDVVKSFASGLNSAGAKFAIEFGTDIIGEFGEEWAQEVLTPFFKKIATGKHEDIDWGQAAYAGMLGALSAGVMNGVEATTNRVNNLSTARQIKKDGNVGKLKEIGNTFSADTLAYKLASKVDEKTSTWKLATLINEMNGTLSEQNVADIKYQLMREGVLEADAQTIAEYLGKAVDGENLTALQRKALDTNPIIQRVFKKVVIDQNSTVNQRLNALMDVYGKEGHAGVDYSAIAKSQSKESLSESATIQQFMKGMETEAIKDKYGIGKSESYNEMMDSKVAEAKALMHNAKVNEGGKTTDSTTGKEITLKKVKDAKAKMFELADGSTINSKNVEYSDDDEAILYETVLSRGYDTATANAVINGLKAAEGLSVTQYLNGVDEAIEYGKIGYPMDKISTNGFYADLSDSMKKFAYNLGKDTAKADTESAQARVDKSKGKVVETRSGSIIFETEESGMTPRQEASITTLGKIVTDITHSNVHIFESVEKTVNGKKVRVFSKDTAGFKAGTIADNGFYDKSTGDIYIDLHAGMNGEGVILWTAAHELTHFIHQWSPAKFKVLADFLTAEYGKKGVDVRELVYNKMAESKRKKLTYEEAYEEVVADAMQTMFTDTNLAEKVEKLKNTDKGLWNKIKQFFRDLYNRVKGEYKGLDAQTEEAKLVREMGNTIKRLSDLFAEALVDAGNTYANVDIKAVASGEVDIDGNANAHAFSIRSMAEGAGLSFEYDTQTGEIRILDMLNGTEVTSVTKEQIKTAPLGNIVTIAKQNGFISDAEANKQYGFLADLVNLCLNHKENFTMVWEIAGTQVFSAIKANSDTQYGKTIDFSTVCKKTQQVINVISETQKRLKRGLTKDEIKNIVYYETGKAGEPTPCPVCYVFSRWMGIGGILQQMSDFQKKYEGATEEDMRNFINDVESEIIKHANTPNKSGKLKGEFFDKNGKPKFGTVIADLKAKANSKIKGADIRLKIQETETLLEKADVADKAKLQKTLERHKKKLAKEGDILDAKLKEAEALLSRYEEYQWLTKTYMDEVKAEDGTHLGWKRDENFKPVDEDVLWDLREGARFATEYPKSWLYRTTKGCNAGKAILPYSDARVGETIQGVAYSNVKDIIIGENNAFLNGDTKAQADYVTRAIKKQLAQNLIGGMRYQSTSDFRYEYGSDYLITFLEMQAIGAKVQLYTKVIEAVDFLCTMGAEVNLSVMPLNDGYIELADGRKQLVFSSVTGINAEAAIAKTKQYDNAQLILVGISDEHIRLALEGDDVNGDVVTFVIPFHGSGNTVKAIQELMDLLGEDLDVTKAQDYSLVQTDHFAKNRTAEQTALWDLRKKIISRSYKRNGNTVSWDGKLTSAEEALLNSENGSKFLKDLYNRFYVDKNADEYGVSLSTAQAEQIFPYEYWDKSLTYAEADRNGERFKEYCATMGIIPRFSGVDSSGKELGYGNFTNTKGYWKLLIDRKMYNNDGTYHSPSKINISNFKSETLDPAWGSVTYGDVMQKDTNPKKTNAITENVIRQIEAKATDNLMFSVRNIVGVSGKDYGTGVYLDSTLLTNLTEDERVDMVKEYLKELGGSAFTAYDSNGNAVDVHIVESHRKFRNAKGKRIYANHHLTNYNKNPIKQEAIALVDEVILTARQGTHETPRHPHGWLDNNGQNDWDVWTTYLQDKENTVWEATLHIANSANGEKILYEIHPIKKVEGVEKLDTQSTNGRIAQNPNSVNTLEENSSASDFVNHMLDIVKNTKGWYAKDVFEYVEANPEINYIERIYSGDKTAKKDLEAFLNTVNDVKVLEKLSWYMCQAYGDKGRTWSWDEGAKYPYRGATRTFQNAVKKRINAIVSEQVGGTNLGIKNGEVSLQETKALYDKLNGIDEFKPLAEKVFATAEKLGVNIRFANQVLSSSNVAGDNLGDMVEYKTSLFNNTAFTDQYKANTILHELIHVCTVYVLDHNSSVDNPRADQTWRAGTRLHQIFDQIQSDPDFKGQYGLTNTKEMVAELSNEEFVGLLKKKNLWDRILEAIANLFGFVNGKTAYDSAMQCLDYILDNPEIEVYKDYVREQRENARYNGMDVFGKTEYTDYYGNDRVMYSERILMGSLFSGGGTLEAGLTYQMLDKQFGVEYDGKIASVYADNHGDHIQVGRVEDFDISKYKDIFYLHASPVCHNFSTAKHGAKELQMDIDSAKATAKHLETAMPQVFTVENAPGYRKSQSLKIITDKLTELGYKWDVDVYNSADYGSATSRNRVILRAVKDGELPPKPTKQERTNSWDKVTRDLWDTLPKSALRPSFISAIENTPTLPIFDANGKVNVNKPLLILTTTNGHTVTYCWEGEVCPTLTTKCGEAKLVMPDGNIYAVTPEFMGRIQGLPNDYKYPKEKTRAFTIIGNGIPTHLTKAVVGGVLDSAYEQTHNGDILYSERTDNAIDNRSLLVNALESVAQNDVEKSWLAKYKAKIADLNEKQNKLAEIRAEIQKTRFTKGADRSKLTELENNAKTLADQINRADKKLLELEASKALKGVVERERAKAYQLGKAKVDEYRKDRAESTARNYYRPRIEKVVSDLRNRLEHPTAKTAIPEAFSASVAKVLSAFNFTTYDKDGKPRPSKANMSRAEAQVALAELANQLSQNSLESQYGQLDIPPEMLEWIKEMAEFFKAASNLASEEFTINKMNEVQLKSIYKFLRSLQTSLNNAGKYYTNAHYDVASDANSTMEHLAPLPTTEKERGKKLAKMLNWDLASPTTVFDRFGEGGKHVFQMLIKGQSKEAYNIQTILDFVEKAYTEKEAKEWRETLVPITIDGKEYKVTIEYLMGLHCLLKQEDSKRHILEGGGIRFGDVKHKGKTTRFTDTFFKEADAIEVEKILDKYPRAREVADAMQRFMEETGSAWGNEVSMIRFGYRAFTIKGYYPIRTIAAGSDYEAQQKRANIYALLNKSFTKERTPNANNVVIVDGIFSVFNNHMSEMALYNAWAMPVIDAIKWFNYKESQDVLVERSEKSVHESLRLAYGTKADEYVRRLFESINGQRSGGLSQDIAFDNLRKVNRVAVAGNVRVALQQPFSITRAFELINPKYVTPLVGKARDIAYEEMLANSGIAKWKSLGYYDVNVSMPLEAKVFKNETFADKATEKLMKAAEDGDAFTWTALWNACKKETAEKNKGISEAELLNKTAERFDDLVLRTQVVDSVLTKSQWMRADDFWHRATSSFMSEPIASYNALLRQYDKYSRDLAIHGAKYAIKNNFKGMKRAVGIFVLTQLVNALVTAPLDALRDDDDYETYLEKLLANLKDNAIMNLLPTSMIPWIGDIVDYIKYRRTDRSDMAFIIKGVDLARSIVNTIDNYSYYKLHNTFKQSLEMTSYLSGLPISNLWRDAVAIWNTVASPLGYGELKFQTQEDKHSEGYKKMYEAIFNGNEDRAEELYGQLLSNGVEEDKIYNGLVNAVKDGYTNGDLSAEEAKERIKTIIAYMGKTNSDGTPITDNDIYWKIDKWEYAKDNGSSKGYSKYDDIFTAMEQGNPSEAIKWHIEDKTNAYLEEARAEAEAEGKSFNETKAKKEAKSKAESAVKSAITSYWKPKYKEAYKNNDTEEMKRIRYMLRDTKLYGTTSELLDTVKGWLKD